MQMADFVTGVCGRPHGNGGFRDTHHNVDDEEGDEGQHLPGNNYTPEQCQAQCLADANCMGAEQKASHILENGVGWCALFYTTETVTAIGVAQNPNFRCSLKT